MFTCADQSPLESTSHFKAEGDPSNTIISELPAVPQHSTAMHGMETATDDITRALAIEARVICTKATDFLDEKPEEVLDDSEEEREMNTSITPCKFPLLSSFSSFFLRLL